MYVRMGVYACDDLQVHELRMGWLWSVGSIKL